MTVRALNAGKSKIPYDLASLVTNIPPLILEVTFSLTAPSERYLAKQ